MFAKLGLKFPVLWLCPFPCFAIQRDVSTRSHENSEERANGLLLETASMTLSKRNAMCGQPHVQPKAREIEDCLKQKMGDAQSFFERESNTLLKAGKKNLHQHEKHKSELLQHLFCLFFESDDKISNSKNYYVHMFIYLYLCSISSGL
jgi:transcriptional regulator of heat shock response